MVNIITGAGKTGAALVNHPDVNKIAFTGSTEVGKIIQRSIAGTNKRSTLELGGKAANIVFEDAPIDQAVEGVVNGIFFNQGHVCCAGSRLCTRIDRQGVHSKTEGPDRYVDRGRPDGQEHRHRGHQLQRPTGHDPEIYPDRQKEGSAIYQPVCRLPKKGFWCPPTLFTDVAQSNRIAQEEIFGPVLAILTFRTDDEVIEKANNTPYGLSAGVWTDKGSRIFNLTRRLRAGVVWANTFNKFDAASPFGGYKESGFGREGGLHGLSPYLDLHA